RLGHLHTDTILQMACKGLVSGMSISSSTPPLNCCEPCIKGKQTHEEILKHTSICTNIILRCVFSDLYGPMLTQSHQG
ncbi:hypothetical protein BJV74DRAFT_755596, partial [Russula compacta]